MPPKKHISVCICTYKRPQLLAQLLSKLKNQKTGGLFEYSIVVVDNDKLETARQIVESHSSRSQVSIGYYVEPEQNIALARNMAVQHARGDFIAFIDDDESPIAEWLFRLHAALQSHNVDGVLGPVKPLFAVPPPSWMIEAHIFERPGYQQNGVVLDWKQTGTGNMLARRDTLNQISGPFRREFGSGGEDQDFFRRAIEAGKVFFWCQDAIVYETVPVERTRLSFQLRRALLRGKVSLTDPSNRVCEVLKSLVAFGLYTSLLPVFFIIRQGLFISYLIKNFDHMGRILGAFGIDIVREKYVVK